MSNDIIREFNIKCLLVVPDDKFCKPYITLQVPKGITISHQLESLPNEIHTLISNYLHNDINTMTDLKSSLKKLSNKPSPKNDHITVQYDNFPQKD